MAYELGIIGAGMMAEAIAGGVIRSGVLRADQMIASDVSPERRGVFQSRLNIQTVEDNVQAAGQARAILLSVKPHQAEEALAGLGRVIPRDSLIISIIAGISTAFIENHLDNGINWRVIRTMPNTPMLVGAGVVAIAGGRHATTDDLAMARRIFQAAATVLEMPEEKIHAVTAISGSGPAYFFFLIEQMIRAGMELGLSAEESRTLVVQTAVGAAKMMSESNESPHELRRRVTTPNGTTHAAISHMESHNWHEVTVNALKAAAQRSRELGR